MAFLPLGAIARQDGGAATKLRSAKVGRLLQEKQAALSASAGSKSAAVPAGAPDDQIPGVPMPLSIFGGALSDATDVDDVYHIELTPGLRFNVCIVGPEGTDFDLFLFPPDSDDIFTDPAVALAQSASYPDCIDFTVPEGLGGTYFLDVFALTGSGTYTIFYNVGGDEADDNAPGIVLPPSPVAGTLDNTFDADDVFRVDLSEGIEFNVCITGADGTDFDLLLFPPGTTDIITEGFVAGAETETYPDCFSFIVPAGQGGSYFLDAFGIVGVGDYTIAYSFDTDSNVPGSPIPPSPIQGDLDAQFDRSDLFAVELSDGARLEACITSPAGADFDLFLFPPGTTDVTTDEFTVAAETNVSPDCFEYTVPAGQGGLYFLNAFAFEGQGSYSLTYSVSADLNAQIVSHTVPTFMTAGESAIVDITMRNTGTMPWSANDNFSLAVIDDPCQMTPGTRIGLPSGVTVNTGAEHTFQLILTAPASSGPCQVTFQMVQEFVQFFGATLSPTVGVDALTLAFDAEGQLGWTGFVITSAGASFGHQPGSGLCIFTPLAGDNAGLWESPRNGAVPLIRNSVYRIRFSMTTDQLAGGAQPVWNILVDNLDEFGRINWGSDRWFFGNTEFANAIGNSGFDGLTQFDSWVVPSPVRTDAWNGVVDAANSPFDPANIESAAFNIKFRVLDVEGFPGSDQDTGNMCLKSVQVDRFDLSALVRDGGPIWGDTASLAPEVGVVTSSFSGAESVLSLAQVDSGPSGGPITIELDEAAAAGPNPGQLGSSRAFVQFEDTSFDKIDNRRFFPVAWNDGELLELTAEIRATSANFVNPVDVIAMGWQAATNEIGGFDFSFRGAPGGIMDRAASPRGDSVANSTYTSFFYTHHSTDVDLLILPNADRLRGVLDFFNRTDLAGALGEGILSDPFEIRSMAIHRIVYDDATFGARPAE